MLDRLFHHFILESFDKQEIGNNHTHKHRKIWHWEWHQAKERSKRGKWQGCCQSNHRQAENEQSGAWPTFVEPTSCADNKHNSDLGSERLHKPPRLEKTIPGAKPKPHNSESEKIVERRRETKNQHITFD